MQLRLCCNSPHNFYWPFADPDSADKTLTTSSGKLLLLDRLIPHLLSNDHKVLIFSQFTTTLDILSTWATSLHDWKVCRIDGSVPQTERRAQIQSFNQDPTTQIFLLSTRAGGQGINLAAADTVVLFDSDWNPQQDLQAQDRAHRIGQTRPVIVYRLATKGTVEQTLLEKADGKRRLEKLVIRKGKFRSLKAPTATSGADGGGTAGDDMDELARLLEQNDGDAWDLEEEDETKGKGLLSDADLKILTDRSEEAYARAERGEDGAGVEDGERRFKGVETRRDQGVLKELGRRE